ncbi:MAG: hypothetical protein VX949_10500, partial [Planctomycetota bacterium]|nr:hypothetical protein [Planctomycetota bacterium]
MDTFCNKALASLYILALLGFQPTAAHCENKPELTTGTQQSKPAKAVFADGQAQVVDAFKDSEKWIQHDLWVETTFDTDGDGKLDRMHVDVTRQR